MTAAQIISTTPISMVWRALGGGELRRGKGRAWWRNGDGFSVSLDDDKGAWYDFRDSKGGGILDLVVQVQGGTRAEALKWLAGLTGVTLEDGALSPAGRRRHVLQQRAFQSDLRLARWWRRAALLVADQELVRLKGALFNPGEEVDAYSIRLFDELGREVHAAGDAALVAIYRYFRSALPRLTAAMTRDGRLRDIADRRVAWRVIMEGVADAPN